MRGGPIERHARTRAIAGLLAALALSVMTVDPRDAAAEIQLPDDFHDHEIVGGLDEPTGFAFLPDGRVLITEQRTARVRMVVNGHVAAVDPVLVVPDVSAQEGERGLLGIAVDPDWPVRPFVYVLFDHIGGTQRLVRYLAGEDVELPGGENLTLGSPRVLIGDIPDDTENHNGGGLRFGPDGSLFVSLGDDGFPCRSADSTSLNGKILRLRVNRLPIYGASSTPRDSITPPDNPFAASPDSNARLVYATGLRNPWRFHIDPADGQLFTCDVGENLYEEMSAVAPGDFLGWPWREGDFIRSRLECPEPGGEGAIPYRGPLVTCLHSLPISYAIVSAGVYRPKPGAPLNWPAEYHSPRGDVFYGQYYEGWLRRLHWNGSAWEPAAPAPGQPDPESWATGIHRAADFEVGPDGSLWWLAQFNYAYGYSTGALHRIVYTGSPTAVGADAPAGHRLRVAPNPSRGAIEFSFALPEAGRARLALFDLAGRRVRTFPEAFLAAGEHRLRWDGRSDSGVASPGLYLARLERDGALPLMARVLRLE